MASFELKLLGPPTIESRDSTVTMTRQKSIGILAYLTATERKISRNELASLFWPDSQPSKALGALRTILADISGTLSSQVFRERKEYIQIDDEIVACDVRKFREKKRRGETLNEMMDAARLWNGGFLKGFELKGTPRFTDWQYLEEQNLEQEYRWLLNKMTAIQTESGEDESALACRKKLQELDPYDEENHRELMKLYARTGDKTSAMRQLRICRKYLVEDLGFPLEEETEILADEIRRNSSASPLSIIKTDTVPVEKRDLRLAVLPFVFEEREQRDQPDFSHIVSEAITDFCTLQNRIEIISRTSTLSYRNSEKNLPRIAAELKADFMIEGEIEDRGENLLIKARLINASRDSVSASERRECQPAGVAASNAARIISAGLIKHLNPDISPQIPAKEDPGLPWRMHGFSLLKESNRDLQKQAESFFNRALELNPADASAWAGIGLAKLCVCNAGFLGEDTDRLFREAREAAEKALEIEPEEPTALGVMGWYEEDYAWNFDSAEMYYNRSIIANPNDPKPYQGLAFVLMKKRRLAEAIKMGKKAFEMDPVSIWSIAAYYWPLITSRQYKKAHEIDKAARSLYNRETWDGFDDAIMDLYIGRYEEAANIMERIHDLLIEEKKETLLFVQAYAYEALGLREKAEKIISFMTEGRERSIGFSVPLAAVYTKMDQFDMAMDLIDEALENRDPGVGFLISYPFYEPLYAFPRFQEQLKKAGFSAWLDSHVS